MWEVGTRRQKRLEKRDVAAKGNNNANHCMFEVQMNKRFNVKKIRAFPQNMWLVW